MSVSGFLAEVPSKVCHELFVIGLWICNHIVLLIRICSCVHGNVNSVSNGIESSLPGVVTSFFDSYYSDDDAPLFQNHSLSGDESAERQVDHTKPLKYIKKILVKGKWAF
jgi:hypothetical protein